MRIAISIAAILAVSSAHAWPNPPHPFSHADALHLPHVYGVDDDAHWSGVTPIVVKPVSLPWQGNTKATVEAQFPVIMEYIFRTRSSAALNIQMATVTDLQLARLSHFYYIETRGNTAPLMALAAQKLTPYNLVRWRAAFGAATDTAVGQFSPSATLAAYRGLAKSANIHQSHAAHIAAAHTSFTLNGQIQGIAAPSVDMTLGEIYSEFLFNGAESELGAFASAAKYVLGEIGWPIIGWQAGSAFYSFASTIDPNYGYDLATTYGDIAGETGFGPFDGFWTIDDSAGFSSGSTDIAHFVEPY